MSRRILAYMVHIDPRYLANIDNAIFQFFSSLFEFHSFEVSYNRFCRFTGSCLAFLCMDCLEHFGYQLLF